MTIRSLFATQLYEADLSAERGWARLRDDLQDACLMLADEDAGGRAWCRANGYPGYTSYASLSDLPQRATAFADLKRLLDRHARRFTETLLFDLAASLRLDSLWVNVLKPGGAHTGHVHPNSVLSGTAYVTVPPGSSALRLEDPRLPLMMAAPKPRADAPETARRFVSVEPQPGSLLMWESWLRHEVPVNRAKQPRISIRLQLQLSDGASRGCAMRCRPNC